MPDIVPFVTVAPELARLETRVALFVQTRHDPWNASPQQGFAFFEAFEVGPGADPSRVWLEVRNELVPGAPPMAMIHFSYETIDLFDDAEFFQLEIGDEEFGLLVDTVRTQLFTDRAYLERLGRHRDLFDRLIAEQEDAWKSAAQNLPQGHHTRQDFRRLESARRRLAQVVAASAQSNRRTRKSERRARAIGHSPHKTS